MVLALSDSQEYSEGDLEVLLVRSGHCVLSNSEEYSEGDFEMLHARGLAPRRSTPRATPRCCMRAGWPLGGVLRGRLRDAARGLAPRRSTLRATPRCCAQVGPHPQMLYRVDGPCVWANALPPVPWGVSCCRRAPWYGATPHLWS